MGFKCPVDGCPYKSFKYPRSAGMSDIQTHLWDEHEERMRAYTKARRREKKRRSLLDRLWNGSELDINDFAPAEA